jgi:hypothetical protein
MSAFDTQGPLLPAGIAPRLTDRRASGRDVKAVARDLYDGIVDRRSIAALTSSRLSRWARSPLSEFVPSC